MDLTKVYGRVRLFYRRSATEIRTQTIDTATLRKAVQYFLNNGGFDKNAIALRGYEYARSMQHVDMKPESDAIVWGHVQDGFVIAGVGNEVEFIDYLGNKVDLFGRGPQSTSSSGSVPGPRKPVPALPVEVWNSKSINTDVAMSVMRDLCKGQAGA